MDMDIKSKKNKNKNKNKNKKKNVRPTQKIKHKNNHRECFNSESIIPNLKRNNYSKNVNSNNPNKSHQLSIKPGPKSPIKHIVHIYDSLSKTCTSYMPQKVEEIEYQLNQPILINYLQTFNDFPSQNQKVLTKIKVDLNTNDDHSSTESMTLGKKQLIYKENSDLDSNGVPDYEARLLALKKRVVIMNVNYKKMESLRKNLGIDDERTPEFSPITPSQSSSVQEIVPLFVEPTFEMPTYNGEHDSATDNKSQNSVSKCTTKLSALKLRLTNFFKFFYRSSIVTTNTVNPKQSNDVTVKNQLEPFSGKSKSKRSWFSARVLIKFIYLLSFVTLVKVLRKLYT